MPMCSCQRNIVNEHMEVYNLGSAAVCGADGGDGGSAVVCCVPCAAVRSIKRLGRRGGRRVQRSTAKGKAAEPEELRWQHHVTARGVVHNT